MKQETNSTKKYYYCFTSITIDGNRESTKLEMISRFDSFFDFKGSDTKSRFFPSEMFDGEQLCVKDTAANGVFIISTSSPIESWEQFAIIKDKPFDMQTLCNFNELSQDDIFDFDLAFVG